MEARHDALTRLPNRYLITEVLQAYLDRGLRPVVMFVDIDRFKLVNEGIGHGGGDKILVLLGERLLAAVRPGDMVGRFGCDEFIIVCENMLLRSVGCTSVVGKVGSASLAVVFWPGGIEEVELLGGWRAAQACSLLPDEVKVVA